MEGRTDCTAESGNAAKALFGSIVYGSVQFSLWEAGGKGVDSQFSRGDRHLGVAARLPAEPHAVSPDTLVNAPPHPRGPHPLAARVETGGHLPLCINWHDKVLYVYRILAIQNKDVRLGFTILCLWTLYICTLRPSRPSQRDTTDLQRGSLGGSARFTRRLLPCLLCLAGSPGDGRRLRSDE